MHFLQSAGENFGTFAWGQLSLTVWLLIALALLFDFLNGFHDSANSVATVVSTRVLSPHMAVIWAAFFNFVAFLLFPLTVAGTMGKGIIDPRVVDYEVIAGQGPGMSQRHSRRHLAAPGLQRKDGLAAFKGSPRYLREAVGFADGLHEEGDDLRRLVFYGVLEGVGH